MCLKIGGPNGVIICGIRPPTYCACGRPADFLCDWKVAASSSGRPQTCSVPICAAHAKKVARGKHLCPLHQKQWDDWQRKHPPAQPSLFEKEAAA